MKNFARTTALALALTALGATALAMPSSGVGDRDVMKMSVVIGAWEGTVALEADGDALLIDGTELGTWTSSLNDESPGGSIVIDMGGTDSLEFAFDQSAAAGVQGGAALSVSDSVSLGGFEFTTVEGKPTASGQRKETCMEIVEEETEQPESNPFVKVVHVKKGKYEWFEAETASGGRYIVTTTQSKPGAGAGPVQVGDKVFFVSWT